MKLTKDQLGVLLRRLTEAKSRADQATPKQKEPVAVTRARAVVAEFEAKRSKVYSAHLKAVKVQHTAAHEQVMFGADGLAAVRYFEKYAAQLEVNNAIQDC